MEYCGSKEANAHFTGYIASQSEENRQKAETAFPSFESLWPYLNLIAKANSLEPLDGQVIEAYWLGNSLLEKVGMDDLKKVILTDFTKPGLLPKSIAKKKTDGIPEGIMPCHSFHVLYINFITGKVEPLLKNLDNCLVHWGAVIAEEKGKLFLESQELVSENGKFGLVPSVRQVDMGFASEADIGYTVSFHWNHGIELLSEKQAKNLEKYTLLNLEKVNSALE